MSCFQAQELSTEARKADERLRALAAVQAVVWGSAWTRSARLDTPKRAALPLKHAPRRPRAAATVWEPAMTTINHKNNATKLNTDPKPPGTAIQLQKLDQTAAVSQPSISPGSKDDCRPTESIQLQ